MAIEKIDYDGFSSAIEELRASVSQSLGPEDLEHLWRIERFGKLFSVLGYATAWIIPNPLSAFCISQGLATRWLLQHHISHGGYDKVPGVPERYTSKKFARGWRRFIDWFDWILPEAWHYEHDILHHYHTGEETDPDLVERNLEDVRQHAGPKIIKYLLVALGAMTWKFTYYAPNTLNALESKRRQKDKTRPVWNITPKNFYDLRNPLVREVWRRCYLPFFALHFVALPLLFWPLGQTAVLHVLINRVLAEIIQNVHTLFIIAPNHAGEDLYRFDYHYPNKKEFYVNQVLGSVNYCCGSEAVDYSQMWLNYQIEHHLFPALPMRTYRQIQPIVKQLCAEHHIPYIQEHVLIRSKRFIDICVGNTTMKRLDSARTI